MSCKQLPNPGGQPAYSWHDAIELVGGQNWHPSWGHMQGDILDDGNTTNGSGVGLHGLTLLDQHGRQHHLEFPTAMDFVVQFADYC